MDMKMALLKKDQERELKRGGKKESITSFKDMHSKGKGRNVGFEREK